MNRFFLITPLIFLMALAAAGCVSVEQQRQISTDAQNFPMEGRWWNNSKTFSSAEEARHHTDVLFEKLKQITRFKKSKGLSGILAAAEGKELYNAGEDFEVSWSLDFWDQNNAWIDLEKESLEEKKFRVAVCQAAVFHNGKGIYTSYYGVRDGYAFSNNSQQKQWNETTRIEYGPAYTKTRIWTYLEE